MSDTTGQTPAITDDMIVKAAKALEASQLRQAEIALRAGLAGRTVVELPEPDRHGDYETGYATVWPMLDGRVSWGNGSLQPETAESFGRALLAAARDARRLAAESGQDGEPNG